MINKDNIGKDWVEEVVAGRADQKGPSIPGVRFTRTSRDFTPLRTRMTSEETADTKKLMRLLCPEIGTVRTRINALPQLNQEKDRADGFIALTSALHKVIREFVALGIKAREASEADVDQAIIKTERHFDFIGFKKHSADPEARCIADAAGASLPEHVERSDWVDEILSGRPDPRKRKIPGVRFALTSDDFRPTPKRNRKDKIADTINRIDLICHGITEVRRRLKLLPQLEQKKDHGDGFVPLIPAIKSIARELLDLTRMVKNTNEVDVDHCLIDVALQIDHLWF